MSSDAEAIRSFVVAKFLAGDDTAVGPDTDLVEDDTIDSLGIFDLVSFMEDELGVEIDPEDIVLENFACLAAMERLVASKRT